MLVFSVVGEKGLSFLVQLCNCCMAMQISEIRDSKRHGHWINIRMQVLGNGGGSHNNLGH